MRLYRLPGCVGFCGLTQLQWRGCAHQRPVSWTQAVLSGTGAATMTDTLDTGPVSLASAEAVLAAVTCAAGPAASVIIRSIGSVCTCNSTQRHQGEGLAARASHSMLMHVMP